VTDGSGQYRIPQLPPGSYTVRLEKETFKPSTRGGITVRVGSTIRVNIELLPEAIKAEEIVVVGRAPTVDVGSTTTGVSVGSEFVRRIALSPPAMKGSSTRSFESMAEIAPTAYADTYGMSVSGTTSPENQYIIDGLSVNDPGFGILGTPLSVEFVKEVNIITGGYMPEYGRATGGVLDAVTKSGSNEFHGSVFASITPGAFEGPREIVKREGQTILTNTTLSSLRDFGVEFGGPILKDKLWFFVGFTPSFARYKLERFLNARTIENGEVVTDEAGFTRVTEIPNTRRTFYADQRNFQYIGKLTYLLNQDHNVTLSIYGSPSSSGGNGTFGITPSTGQPEVANIAGTYDAIANRFYQNSNNISLKWASSFLNKSLLFDATLGWYNGETGSLPSDGTGLGSRTGLSDVAQVQYRRSQRPGFYSITEFENSPEISAACLPLPSIDPALPNTAASYTDPLRCPVTTYVVGGPGFINEAQLDRYQGKAVVTRLLSALGQHIIKAGIDIELMSYAHRKAYTGTTVFRESLSGASFSDFRRYGFLSGPDEATVLDVFEATSTSTTVGGFIQDSWSILDKVTVNAGVRYDAQVLTGDDGKVGLSLPNQWSPRIGVIYDFTQQGRSKIFVNYARYFESVPLNIADRSFPGERQIRAAHRAYLPYNPATADRCNPRTPAGQKGPGCGGPDRTDSSNSLTLGGPEDPNQVWQITGGDKVPVDPDISPQSSDEIVVGGEYEVFADGRVGVQYTKRYMNSVMEDMSRDDGATYFVGNPGRGIARDFPEATRDYDAVTLYFTKVFSNQWMAQASYTLSYLRGNWAGLFRPESGQLDPNINSDFDLISLLPNREGPLPGDKTHQFKLYGAKDFSLTKWMNGIVGLTFRARSGEPTSHLGGHALYGDDEAFILQRGSGQRLPPIFNFDSHVGMGFRLSKDSELTVGVDIFNIFNFQGVTAIDDTFTRAAVNPIVGGTTDDLPQKNPTTQEYECVQPTCKLENADKTPFEGKDVNPNFGNPTQYQEPRQFRFTAKVTF
jgi:outer membrane receptor protein involved in Fe transport